MTPGSRPPPAERVERSDPAADRVGDRVGDRAADRAGDGGSILILVAGLVAVLLLLIAVVADVSTLFLARRSLAATADGAASRAAQAVAIAAVYGQLPGGDALPVTTAAAERAVQDYLAGLPPDGPPVQLVEVTSDGTNVTVRVAIDARLPFSSWVSADPAGVEVTAQATARTVVAR